MSEKIETIEDLKRKLEVKDMEIKFLNDWITDLLKDKNIMTAEIIKLRGVKK